MRRLLAAVLLGGAAYTARRYLSVRDALTDIPRELRSPLLPFLATDTTAASLPRARAVYGRVRTPSGRGVTVTERRVGSTGVIHGGGMVLGSPHTEAIGSGRTSRELDAVVVSPDYRLAPEHRFPAALDDCMAALHWMREAADELGIDPGRIAVTGSSAGGGLSAAVAQRAYDEGVPLRAQALVYPMLDDETCWFLAADFDKHSWADDIAAFRETCEHLGVPVAIERSRSGNGAHAWFFFTAPVPAITARRKRS